jgi:hypothetical protein
MDPNTEVKPIKAIPNRDLSHLDPNTPVYGPNNSWLFWKDTVAYCWHHGFYMNTRILKSRKCLSRDEDNGKRCKHVAEINQQFWDNRRYERDLKKWNKEREQKRVERLKRNAAEINARKAQFEPVVEDVYEYDSDWTDEEKAAYFERQS